MAGVRDYLSLIKFSHSIFALPFALMAFLVAVREDLQVALLLKVVLAMVFARAAAMAYNRWTDRHLDAINPRTQEREIPKGVIHPGAALAFAVGCGLGFLLVGLWIAPICFWLGFPVLAVLLGYSHAKRFTVLSHIWLGFALGLAPPAAWIAATGALGPSIMAPCALGLGVLLWVMGFDILYACQDEAFDREQGLHSLPARVGRPTALHIAALAHLWAIPLFWWFGHQVDLGVLYYAGVGLAAVVLFIEHRVVRPDDLSRVNVAFFTMNGLVGVVMLVCTLLDLYAWV
jgi:4-hydroxybenzoate polyprenyltransferase